MLRKILILITFFYFLALFQTTFLIHFNIKGYVLDLILITVLLINFFESPQKNSGLYSAAIGGFFKDIFSTTPIGFYVLILLGLAIFIKIILRRYVRAPAI